jgi:hypothetical protein
MYAILALLLILFITPVQPQPHVILVTIDGTRWQEIYNGTDPYRYHHKHLTARQLVPNLYTHFVDRGIAVGKLTPMIASGPNHISLPGYLEITRGHPSVDCQTNYCNPIIDQSVLWFFQHPAVFSSWSTIQKTVPDFKNIYSDTGPGYRLDNATEIATMAYLEHNIPDFLWVALGDTDEFAHANDYDAYIRALQMADYFIGYLVNKYPDATVIVTCDHGRSADFRDHGPDKESERVWLMMKGPKIPAKGIVAADKLRLSDIFQTVIDTEFGTTPNQILSKVH